MMKPRVFGEVLGRLGLLGVARGAVPPRSRVRLAMLGVDGVEVRSC